MLTTKPTKLETLAHRRARKIRVNYARERDLTRVIQIAWLDGYKTRSTRTTDQLKRLEPTGNPPAQAKRGATKPGQRQRPKK